MVQLLSEGVDVFLGMFRRDHVSHVLTANLCSFCDVNLLDYSHPTFILFLVFDFRSEFHQWITWRVVYITVIGRGVGA
jgi:hypothetical protein